MYATISKGLRELSKNVVAVFLRHPNDTYSWRQESQIEIVFFYQMLFQNDRLCHIKCCYRSQTRCHTKPKKKKTIFCIFIYMYNKRGEFPYIST